MKLKENQIKDKHIEMDEEKFRDLVSKLDVRGSDKSWEYLSTLGVNILPYFLDCYPKARRYQTRLYYVFYSIRYAREGDVAVELGILALNDKATLVRYRACGLLAYSLRKDVVKYLKPLLSHNDNATVEDARAAINAIIKQNHNLFVDRSNTGKSFWVVNGEKF